jgi:hypothetical protein
VARNRPEAGDRFQAHLIRYLGIDDIDLDLWLMQAEEREKEAVTSNARDNL